MDAVRYAHLCAQLIVIGFIKDSKKTFRGEDESFSRKVLRPDGKTAYVVSLFAMFNPAGEFGDDDRVVVQWSVIMMDTNLAIDRIEVTVGDENISPKDAMDFSERIYVAATMWSHNIDKKNKRNRI